MSGPVAHFCQERRRRRHTLSDRAEEEDRTEEEQEPEEEWSLSLASRESRSGSARAGS